MKTSSTRARLQMVSALSSLMTTRVWRDRVQSTIREARLKPEYSTLYPGVQPGVWLPATVIGQQLLLWHLTAPATPQGERLMSEEHFEFRGGQRRVGSWINMRTRLADG
jgi:hypothetical protein